MGAVRGNFIQHIHHFCLSRVHQANTFWELHLVHHFCLSVFLCASRQWPGFPGFPCTEDEPVQSNLWNMQLRRRVRVWLASMGQFLWRDYLPDRVRFLTLPAQSLIEVHTPFLQFWNPPSSKKSESFSITHLAAKPGMNYEASFNFYIPLRCCCRHCWRFYGMCVICSILSFSD